MEKYTLLTRLGIPKPAATIYIALLKHPAVTISGIAEHTGLYRPLIYKNFPILLEKGLVSKSAQGKRTVYIAESPLKLEASINQLSVEFKTSLEELTELHEASKVQPVIRFFEGASAIAQTYEQLLEHAKKGDVLYRYESPKDYRKNAKFYPKLYRQLATKQNPTGESQIQKFVITNEKTQTLRAPRLDRYSKPVPAKFDLFEYDITQLILGNKVAFIDYATQTASIIENPAFAKFQKQIFKLLFEQL